MGLAFLITSENLQLLSERKVLKESEYSALLNSKAIIEVAQQEGARLVSDGQERRAEALRRGYQEGFEQGERDGLQRVAAVALDRAAALALSRGKMADLVVRAVRELVGEFERERIFALALDRIDALVRDEAFLILRVAPESVDAMNNALTDNCDANDEVERHATDLSGAAKVLPQAARPQAVRVVADVCLGVYDCVVETPAGTIDARLDTQLAAIRGAIRDWRGS